MNWIKLFKYQGFLLVFALYRSDMNIFGFWVVGWTKKRHLGIPWAF